MKTDKDYDEKALALASGETFEKLWRFAASLGIDLEDELGLKTALSVPTTDLILALDEGRIHFESDEDEALFHALLAAVLVVVSDGRIGRGRVQ